MKHSLLLAWICIGCAGSSSDINPRLAPADGQTDVGVLSPVILDGYGLDFPDDHPLPDFVTVVEQTTLEPIEGSLTRTETGVEFLPDVRWAEDTDYLVTVREPLEGTREPGLRLPLDDDGEPFDGVSGFSTRTGARPLVLLISGDRFCLVASQPLLPADLQRLTVDRGGVRLAPTSLDLMEPDTYEDEIPAGDDRGLGVVCGPGDGVQRVWLDEHSVRATEGQELVETVRNLRRFR